MHGCVQRDTSRSVYSLTADWKPPYAINGTYGGVRGGESPLLDLWTFVNRTLACPVHPVFIARGNGGEMDGAPDTVE